MIIQSAYWNWKKNAWKFLLAFLLIASCGCNDETKIYTVGIVSWEAESDLMLEGFKSEMALRGYIEGENVRYLYEFIPVDEFNNVQFIESRIEVLLTQEIDMLLALGREVSLAARNLVGGTDLPVLFGGNLDPVYDGLVESLLQPQSNITGVRSANSIAKALEWLVMITGEKKVYVPYNPNDTISVGCFEEINEAAAKLGIELTAGEVYSMEEAVEAIENLPTDIGAVYRVPSPLLDPKSIEISQAAVRRRIAMCSPHQVDDVILATFAPDLFGAGEMLARFAQKIEQGAKPSDLRVETIDVYFTINLKTAEKIGLDIKNSVLIQAKKIIR